jgi:hypothetical protein
MERKLFNAYFSICQRHNEKFRNIHKKNRQNHPVDYFRSILRGFIPQEPQQKYAKSNSNSYVYKMPSAKAGKHFPTLNISKYLMPK